MPKITQKTRKNDNLNKLNPISIVLWKKSRNEKSLYWKGIITKNENTNEEPLILEFNNNNYYFYKSEISQTVFQNIKHYETKKYWRQFNNLSLDKQKKIIKAYVQKHNQEQNSLHQISVLLRLKITLTQNLINNTLDTKNQNYIKEFPTLYNNISYWTRRADTQKKFKDNKSYTYSEWNKHLKDIMNKYNEKLDNLIQTIEKNNLDIELNFPLEKEQNKLLNLEKTTIADNGGNYNNDPEITSSPESNIIHKKIKNDNLNKLDPIIIILWKKLNNEKSLCWKGIITKNENTNEEPLILEFNNNNYYFYKSEIYQDVIKDNKKIINYFNNLNLDNQKKIIKTYAEKDNQEQNIWYQISVLLRLKITLTQNLINNALDTKNQNYTKEFATLYNNILYWIRRADTQKEFKDNKSYTYSEWNKHLKDLMNKYNEKLDNLIQRIEKNNLDIELNYPLEKEQNKLLNLEKTTIADHEIDNFFFNSNTEISEPNIEELLKETPSSNPDPDYIKNFDLEKLGTKQNNHEINNFFFNSNTEITEPNIEELLKETPSSNPDPDYIKNFDLEKLGTKQNNHEINNFFFNPNTEISEPNIEELLKETPSSNPDPDYIKNFDLEELEF